MPHKRAKRSVRESEKEKKGRDLPPQTHTGSSGYTDNDTPKGATRILNAMNVRQAYHDRRRADADEPSGSRSKGKGKASNQSQSLRNGMVGGKDTLKIMPGESLGQFNRRLEDHMRPVVSQAIKDAAAKQAQQEKEIWQEKKKRREEAKAAKRAKEEKEAEEAEEEGGKKRRRRMPKKEDEFESDDETEEAPNKRRKQGSTAEKKDAVVAPTSAPPVKLVVTKPSRSYTSLDFAPKPQPLPLHDIALAPPILPGLRKSKQPASTSHFAVTGRTPLTAGQKRLMEEERERVVARYREMKEAKRVEHEAAKAASHKPKPNENTGKTTSKTM